MKKGENIFLEIIHDHLDAFTIKEREELLLMSEEKLKQVQQALEEKEKNNQKEESKRKLLCQCEEVIRYFKAMRTKGWA